jgi:hypothetical protein
VANDEHKRILVLTPTCDGKRNDYALFKESDLGNHIPASCCTWGDSGFQGIKKDYPKLDVVIPFKKPKGGKLSPLKKQFNRIVAQGRVVSENAIAGIKRLRSVTDIYRNRRPGMADALMLVASGIWNHHLKMSNESTG